VKQSTEAVATLDRGCASRGREQKRRPERRRRREVQRPVRIVTVVVVNEDVEYALKMAGVLATTGGLIGALVAWMLVDGYAVSTLNFQSMSQVAFAFAVTPELIGEGVISAIVMGLLSAIWPAWRGATIQIAAGLRER
jgi:hypothetical protein